MTSRRADDLPPGRLLGIDLGTKRVGIAMSDPGGVLASPHSVLLRSRRRDEDHRAIQVIIDEWEVVGVVIGMPLSLDGSIGPAARKTLKELKELRRALSVPVEAWDERLSTVSAHDMLRQAGMAGEQRRHVVDKVAAAVILQSWLDREPSLDHHGGTSEAESVETGAASSPETPNPPGSDASRAADT